MIATLALLLAGLVSAQEPVAHSGPRNGRAVARPALPPGSRACDAARSLRWIPRLDGAAGRSEAVPLPSREAVVWMEARASHAPAQEAAVTPSGFERWRWAPNLGVVASAGIGVPWVQIEAGVHGSIAWRSWTTEGRIEPRLGGRLVVGPVFVAPGAGLSFDPAGMAPVGLVSIGGMGPGERVRLVFAVDGRWTPIGGSVPTIDCPLPEAGVPSSCTPPARPEPGGNGVLVSVGVQWARARGRTSP